MKITQVAASVRFSKALGPGEHKTIELHAEGSIDAGEDWCICQQRLYGALSGQLKALWSKNGHSPEHAPEGPEKPVQPPQASGASLVPHGHYCQQHQTEFRRHEKDGRVWYSHKLPKGWCNER
jgi:hypothetical protein